jgi:hypothetical protein
MKLIARILGAFSIMGVLAAEAWADGCGRASAAQRALDDSTASVAVGVIVPLVAGAILIAALRRRRAA